MLELIGLAGLVLLAGAVLRRNAAREENANATDVVAPESERRFAFIKSFGLCPDALRELHVYTIPGRISDFPSNVTSLLFKLYSNGYALGAPIMDILHHGRPLLQGEAIYVAVLAESGARPDRTVAFIDRYRSAV